MPSSPAARPGGAAAEQVSHAIALLSLITSAPGQRLNRQRAMESLGVDEAGLASLRTLIDSLVDEATGVRAVIAEDGTDLVLVGDGGTLRPLRLSFEEGLVLSHVLEASHLDEAARARIRRAVLPLGSDAEDGDAIADGAEYSGSYPKIAEAARIGIRCRLLYRSADDATATWRLIDPCRIDTEQGVAYLIAWDVEADGERRYRLDHALEVSYTADSVVPHPYSHASAAESIRASGSTAVLSFASRELMERTTWAGLEPVDPGRADGRPRATVSYTSDTWLFSQVAAAGGQIEIISPDEVRRRFRTWAQDLFIGPPDA
ncbi:MAG: WYL domain-containing protein [Coriobacteriaceae bacterium]|nr:WYL domain-containing protein [Coriobacteriaceae bacterium]